MLRRRGRGHAGPAGGGLGAQCPRRPAGSAACGAQHASFNCLVVLSVPLSLLLSRLLSDSVLPNYWLIFINSCV